MTCTCGVVLGGYLGAEFVDTSGPRSGVVRSRAKILALIACIEFTPTSWAWSVFFLFLMYILLLLVAIC